MRASFPSGQCWRPIPLGQFNKLIERTAATFNVTAAEIRSRRRMAYATRPRQVVMYIACETLLLSLPQVGHLLERDHTTVLHGVRKVRLVRLVDEVFDATVRKLSAEIAAEPGEGIAIKAAALATLQLRLEAAVNRATTAFCANPAEVLSVLERAFPPAQPSGGQS